MSDVTRKFDGKKFEFVSESWDTRKHALGSLSRNFLDTHYIRFTLDAGDRYVMWARKKPGGGKITRPRTWGFVGHNPKQ